MADKLDLIYFIVGLAITTLGTVFSLLGYRRTIPTSGSLEGSQIERLRNWVRTTTVDLFCDNLKGLSQIYLKLEPEERLRREFELLLGKPDVIESVQVLFGTLSSCESCKRSAAAYARLRTIAATVGVVAGLGLLLPWIKVAFDSDWSFGPLHWIALTIFVQMVTAVVLLTMLRASARSKMHSIFRNSGAVS